MNGINYPFQNLIKSNFSVSAQAAFASRTEDEQNTIIQTIFKRATDESEVSSENFEEILIVKASSTRFSHQTAIPRPDDPLLQPIADLFLGHQNWLAGMFTKGTFFKLAYMALWNKDSETCLKVRQWIRERIAQAISEVPDREERFIYIHNLLALSCLFGFDEEEILHLPIGSQDEYIDYAVDAIELTPQAAGSPLIAYGLRSTDPHASPILVLKCTTYPSDDGFFLSLLTDINPFMPVGGYAFHLSAKYKMEAWLKENSQATIVGLSLGGCLALQAVCHFPQYIKQVYAFNPPGVTAREIETWKEQCKHLEQPLPKVDIRFHQDDPISQYVGSCFAEEWTIHHVYAPLSGFFGKKHFQAHAGVLTVHPQTFTVVGNAKVENNRFGRRYVWPVIQNAACVVLFAISLCFYMVYLIAHNIHRLAVAILNLGVTRSHTKLYPSTS